MSRAEFIVGTGLLIATSFFANAAFTSDRRRKILERDRGRSVVSGETENLEAAHINHDKKNPKYNDISNGRTLTTREHYQDHFDRHGRKNLGLSENGNKWALQKIWERLSDKEREGLNPPELVRRK